mmetsp:Transcript_9480/g.23349  ORF Transcript_9480/g.23349 Transcript_9480/m.23349 type:complete len:1175 (-) Transcript_9480:363-3887(-)|eukprot:CAMPEP_0114520552 /NCGR_PEP_ID=MMETSP0109-20121206/19643_1 /TAXON_ID=29199 /ORGANISM="Chlorarachnion reptans, Strain CCCM449" /LENGTH=1174 /DNA_ID=CAMNT_0001701457 /DNA_START=117 /DNA_END=3641 /DNA_ORIENTATION=-
MGNAASAIGALFDELDIDRNTQLDRKELLNLVKALPFQSAVEELLSKMDEDENSMVSLQELSKGITKEFKLDTAQINEIRARLKARSQTKTHTQSKNAEVEEAEEKDVGDVAQAVDETQIKDKASEASKHEEPETNHRQSEEWTMVDKDKASHPRTRSGALDATPIIEQKKEVEKTEEEVDMVDLESFLGDSATPKQGDTPNEKDDKKKPPNEEDDKKKPPNEEGDKSKPPNEEGDKKEPATVHSQPAPERLEEPPNVDKNDDVTKSDTAQQSWSVGNLVYVWSVKKERWFENGKIVATKEDGSVQVKYSRDSIIKGNKWISKDQQSFFLRSSKNPPPDLKVHPGSVRSDGNATKDDTQVTGEDHHEEKHKVGEGYSDDEPAPPAPQSKPPPLPESENEPGPKTTMIAKNPKIAMEEVQECFAKDSKVNILANGSRRLIYHGPVLRKATFGHSAGYLFVFNDILVSCLTLSGGKLREAHRVEPKPPVPSDAKAGTEEGGGEEAPKMLAPPGEEKEGQSATPEDENEEDQTDFPPLPQIPSGLKVAIKEVRKMSHVAVIQGASSGIFGKSFKNGFTVTRLPAAVPSVGIDGNLDGIPIFDPEDQTDISFGIPGDDAEEFHWCEVLSNVAFSAIRGAQKRAREEQNQQPAPGTEKKRQRKKAEKYAWSSQLWRGSLHSAAFEGDATLAAEIIQRIIAAEAATKESSATNSGKGVEAAPETGGDDQEEADTAESMTEVINRREKSDDATPLHIACRYGHVEVVAECLKLKPNFYLKDKRGLSALVMAVEVNRRFDIASLLVSHGADPNLIMSDEHSLLFTEATRKAEPGEDVSTTGSREKWVGLLMKHNAKARPAEKDSYGNTLIHRAIQSGKSWSAKLVQYLAASTPGDVRRRNQEGNTPLHVAAQMGSAGIITILLSYGAHPNGRNPRNGRTALHLARTPNVAAALLKGGARGDLTDKRGDHADQRTKSAKRFKDGPAKMAKAHHFWTSLADAPPASDLTEKDENDSTSEKQACVFCWDKFSVMRWRYSCARCMQSVCNNCSQKMATQPADVETNFPASKRRVCDGCYNLCRVRAYGIKRAWASEEELKRAMDAKRAKLGLEPDREHTIKDGAVAGGIASTKNQMAMNIQAMKERGERLGEIDDKAQMMADDAKKFASTAKALRQKMQKRSIWGF